MGESTSLPVDVAREAALFSFVLGFLRLCLQLLGLTGLTTEFGSTLSYNAVRHPR